MRKETVWKAAAAVFVLLCLILLLNLAGCEKQEELPSSSLPSQVESSEVVSQESSVPEAESSTFVPAPDLIPSSDVEEMDDFDYAFSQNPIDKDYDEAYSLASSFSMMRQACDQAATRWKTMVSVAYEEACACVSAERELELQSVQSAWEMTLDEEIKRIQDEAGDSNEGILSSSKEIVLLYRQRARELCKIKFDQDGTLPEFPSADTAVG